MNTNSLTVSIVLLPSTMPSMKSPMSLINSSLLSMKPLIFFDAICCLSSDNTFSKNSSTPSDASNVFNLPADFGFAHL